MREIAAILLVARQEFLRFYASYLGLAVAGAKLKITRASQRLNLSKLKSMYVEKNREPIFVPIFC